MSVGSANVAYVNLKRRLLRWLERRLEKKECGGMRRSAEVKEG